MESLACTGAKNSAISPGKILVLNLNRSLIDCVKSRNKYVWGLYRLLGMSCENWQCLKGKLVEPNAQSVS